MGGTWNLHGGGRKFAEFQLENVKGTEHLEDLGVDGRIILELILQK